MGRARDGGGGERREAVNRRRRDAARYVRRRANEIARVTLRVRYFDAQDASGAWTPRGASRGILSFVLSSPAASRMDLSASWPHAPSTSRPFAVLHRTFALTPNSSVASRACAPHASSEGVAYPCVAPISVGL